jgi:hypothetical protein
MILPKTGLSATIFSGESRIAAGACALAVLWHSWRHNEQIALAMAKQK